MVNNEVSKPCTHRGLGSYGRESVQPTTIPEWRDRVPDYGSDVSVNMTSETDIDLDNLHVSRSTTLFSCCCQVLSEIRVWPHSCTPSVIEPTGAEKLTGTEAEHAGTNRSIRRKNL
jgi:hypothetical protein